MKTDPKFKIKDMVRRIDSNVVGEIFDIGIDRYAGFYQYGLMINGLESWEYESNLELCPPEKISVSKSHHEFKQEPKPTGELEGEWRFRKTGKKRQATFGDWYRKADGTITKWKHGVRSQFEYEILELVEQPREVFEMPDELVFERLRMTGPTFSGDVIRVDENGRVNADNSDGKSIYQHYTLKPGQLGGGK